MKSATLLSASSQSNRISGLLRKKERPSSPGYTCRNASRAAAVEAPMANVSFCLPEAFGAGNADPKTTIFVDGAQPGFRNLSHWPPAELCLGDSIRGDVTTEIALKFAKLPQEQKQQLLGSFNTIANNHFDTDGVLSCFVVLHPELALEREEKLKNAAWAGDFWWWTNENAVATRLLIDAIEAHPKSPINPGRFDPTNPGDLKAKWQATYDWCLQPDNMITLLDDPMKYYDLIKDEFDLTKADIARIHAGEDIRVELHSEQDFAIVVSDRPITYFGLFEAAKRHHNILLIRPTKNGNRYLFIWHLRPWFPTVTNAIRRKPLTNAHKALNEAEVKAGGQPGSWFLYDYTQPFPFMGFGTPMTPDVNAFPGFIYQPGNVCLEDQPASRLAEEIVVAAILKDLSA